VSYFNSQSTVTPNALASPLSHSALASDFVLSPIVVEDDPPIDEVHSQVQSFLQEANVSMVRPLSKIIFFIDLDF
jgi:hypothetical protein